MPTAKPRQGHANRHVFVSRLDTRPFEHCLDIHSASSAYADLVPLLGVHVEQKLSFQHSRSQLSSSGHASLLVVRHQYLYRPVLDLPIAHDGQRRRHADPVVSPKRRPDGMHPASLLDCLDWVLEEVVLYVGVFLRDHVYVPLQDDGRQILISRSRCAAQNHVAARVTKHLAACLATYFLHIGQRRLLVMRRTRYSCQSIEMLP